VWKLYVIFFENILFETKELQGKMDGWNAGFPFQLFLGSI